MVLNAKRRRDSKRARVTRVFLDGREVKYCFYADGRRGVVRHWQLAANGKRLFRPDHLGPVALESRGHVEWRPVA